MTLVPLLSSGAGHLDAKEPRMEFTCLWGS